MPIHINAVCEERGCRHAQGLAFEAEHETWGHLLEALRAAGWTIETTAGSVRFLSCPRCSAVATARAGS